MADYYQKTHMTKNKFYLLFAGLTINYVTNKLKHPFNIVYNSG